MAKTKDQLRTENNASFPNNNSQFITPEKIRDYNTDVIDSVALEVNPQLSGDVEITKQVKKDIDAYQLVLHQLGLPFDHAYSLSNVMPRAS